MVWGMQSSHRSVPEGPRFTGPPRGATPEPRGFLPLKRPESIALREYILSTCTSIRFCFWVWSVKLGGENKRKKRKKVKKRREPIKRAGEVTSAAASPCGFIHTSMSLTCGMKLTWQNEVTDEEDDDDDDVWYKWRVLPRATAPHLTRQWDDVQRLEHRLEFYYFFNVYIYFFKPWLK